MTQPGNPPPPGWYPDPDQPGALRYWDGRLWTQHQAPGSEVTRPQPQRRGPRGWLFALAVGAPLLLIGGCLAAVALFSVSSGPPPTCGDAGPVGDLADYRSISQRQYAKIVKNPDGHVGEHLVIYGVVSQFDAATGSTSFLASTAARRKQAWYNYDTNTWVDAPKEQMLADVVQDDFVTMHVQVLGSATYDTQIGGNTTAPAMCVRKIEVTGHAR